MKLNDCPSEQSSHGLHCSCITAQSSRQCCHCGRGVVLDDFAVCVRWIHEDDRELRSEDPQIL